MSMITQAFVSKKHRHPYGCRLTLAGYLLGTMMLACSVDTALAQIGSDRLVDRRPEAQSTISKNQLLTPEKALRATDRARQELIHGHVESAQKQITRALDIAPDCALALDFQGSINVETGHLDLAANSFQKAINNDSALGSAYLGLGMALVGQGQFKKALIPLDRATALMPSAWLVYFEAGLAHLGLGDTEGALEQAKLADRFKETDRSGESGISLLRALIQLRLQNIPRAREYLTQTINYDPHGYNAQIARREFEKFRPPPANAK